MHFCISGLSLTCFNPSCLLLVATYLDAFFFIYRCFQVLFICSTAQLLSLPLLHILAFHLKFLFRYTSAKSLFPFKLLPAAFVCIDQLLPNICCLCVQSITSQRKHTFFLLVDQSLKRRLQKLQIYCTLKINQYINQ